jgi:hypothetical protein
MSYESEHDYNTQRRHKRYARRIFIVLLVAVIVGWMVGD